MDLQWDNNLNIGVNNIDDQNKKLFICINKLIYSTRMGESKDEIINLIDLLEKYVFKHFNEEEAIQNQHNYPRYNLHSKQHEEFKNELKELRNTFEITGDLALFSLNMQEKILKKCRKHVEELDKDLGEFLISKFRKKEELLVEGVV
ncbi:hemerythrin family protein [Clostridium sp.]|uniref:bacteriohemerythrin n=1 Tax=Clostridium sp. TaxID=1506 RepID=UPI00260E3D57|nr:hemerythrin family protein [Clostridium sp.]